VTRGTRPSWSRLNAAKKGAVIKVGVFADARARQGEGPTNAEVAAIHEFGLGHVPERSFLRVTVEQHREEILRNIRTVGKGLFKSGEELRIGLERFGLWFVSKMQARIRAHISPALKQSTIDRKGSSTPLIDSGQLLNSLTYKVGK
jgi:phage gpG-like protein